MADAIGSILGGIGTGAGDLFSGNFGGALSSLGSGLLTGVEDVGGDIGKLFSGNLGGLLGLSGGGGPVSPGTVVNNSSSILPTGGGGAAAAVPGPTSAAGAGSAAGFAAGPGIGAGTGDLSISAAGGPGILPTDIAAAQPALAGPLSFTPGAAASGGSSFLSGILSNPRALASLGALGLDLAGASGNTSQENALKALAAQQAGIQQNQTALAEGEQQGILPLGAESLVQQTLLANEAAIRTKYAQLGMSGSTAEVQDLNAAREQAQALAFQIGSQLASQGFAEAQSATGTESALLQQLLQSGLQRDQELASALGAFGSALSPAPQVTYITPPQATGG